MSRRLLLSRSPGETRVALVDGERLVDLEVHRDHAPSRLGGIYLGRIRKVVGDGRVGFADVGDGEVMADLDPDSAGAAGWSLTEGAAVPILITQDARRGRLARGTTRIAIAGPRLVFLPFGDANGVSHRFADPKAKRDVSGRLGRVDRHGGALIARLRAADAPVAMLNREAAALAAVWAGCADKLEAMPAPGPLAPPPPAGLALLRDGVDPAADTIECDARDLAGSVETYCRTYFPDAPPPAVVGVDAMAVAFEDLDEQIEGALSRRVALDGGGSIVIDRAEGMTAVDIDSGAAFDGAASDRGGRQLNTRAPFAIARQLRLRSIGGLTVVDLVGAPRGEAADAIIAAFRSAFRDDPMRVEIDHVERHGLVTLSRQWSRRPLAEIVSAMLSDGDGPLPESLDTIVLRALRMARRAGARAPATRLVVHLSPPVAAHWEAPPLAPAIAALRAELSAVALTVASHADWPASRVEIEAA